MRSDRKSKNIFKSAQVYGILSLRQWKLKFEIVNWTVAKKTHNIESRGKKSNIYAKIKRQKPHKKLQIWKGMNPFEIIFWSNFQNVDGGNEGNWDASHSQDLLFTLFM